jgi:hypothetical protein
MKFDGFPGEKTILSFKLANGVGWLTTHRLIIQKEMHNPRLNIMERQDPEMHLLSDFDKAEIRGETLTARFKGRQKAKIHLQLYSLMRQLLAGFRCVSSGSLSGSAD